MGLLFPLALWFGLSLPVLIVFYLLKVKRRAKRVSSTWLWRAVIEDTRANVPFQKLRRNLLMFLQLLMLLLLTFALARPVMNMRTGASGSVAILVDASASMAMRDGGAGPTRLEEARTKAHRLVNSLPRDSQALLVEYADRADVLEPLTSDKSKIRTELAKIKVRAAADDFKEALSLAASLLENATDPRIVVFSDSAALNEETLALAGGISATVEACGTESPNYGWTAMDLRRRSATGEADESGVYDLFGQIASSDIATREVNIQVSAGTDVLDVRRVALVPGQETSVVIDGLKIEGEPIVRIVATSDGGNASEDALAMDNEVWAQISPTQQLRVLVCTPGNYFLSRALATLGNVNELIIGPGQEPPAGNYDLVIYDRSRPASEVDAPGLYIALSPWEPTPTTDGAAEELAAGPITNWNNQHPASSLVQWSTITVFAARKISPPPASRVLVESGELPLLILGRANNQTALHLTFDLFRSNFPLRAAFPIFLRNAIDFLTADRRGSEIRSLHGGETYAGAVPAGVAQVGIISPNGERWSLKPNPDRRFTFAQTYVPGLWSVEYDGKPAERFGVNLLSARESSPAVAESISSEANGTVRPVGLAAELRTNQEIWRWVALGVLLLLIVEWAFYQRRLAV